MAKNIPIIAFASNAEDMQAWKERLPQTEPLENCGATLVFVGSVRGTYKEQSVLYLDYEAYETMAIRQMQEIQRQVALNWEGASVSIVHRIGRVYPMEDSVYISVSTPRRASCYEASRFALEELKKSVVIWKKEVYEQGDTWKANQ
jgi:molybdopterin synthase catalytic subunit